MSEYRLGDQSVIFDIVSETSGLSIVEIDDLKSIFNTTEVKNAEVGFGADGGTNNEVRRSGVIWLDDPFVSKNPKYIEIVQKISNKIDYINQQAFKYDLMIFEPLQLTRYHSSNKEFYDFHIDCTPITQNICRKLSFVIQLDDPSDFEGGEFCIINDNGREYNVSKERPELIQKGNLIVFPSFLPHKVTPVTSGVRHSLVGWCSGPRFR